MSTCILTPGPVRVPDFVLDAIRRPVIHQRSPEFAGFFRNLQEGLRYFFQTSHPVVSMPGSGTSGMECAIRSLFRKGETLLVTVNGKFSERWANYAALQGMQTVLVRAEEGGRPSVAAVIEALRARPEISGMVLTHCETSTGCAIDLEEIVYAARKENPELLILADGISTIGILPYYSDVWGIDAGVAASQKSLLNPAGTVFISVSPSAARRLDESRSEDAFDLSPYYFASKENAYPFTPPTQMLYGIAAALEYFREKGLPFFWQRSHAMAKKFREHVTGMGAVVFADPPCDSLTAFYFPEIASGRIYQRLRDEMAIEVAEGQGSLKGRILRVAHFGDIDMPQMNACLKALEIIVKESGK